MTAASLQIRQIVSEHGLADAAAYALELVASRLDTDSQTLRRIPQVGNPFTAVGICHAVADSIGVGK